MYFVLKYIHMYLLYEGLRKYINPCIAGKYASFLFFPVEGVCQAPCIVCQLWVACKGTFMRPQEGYHVGVQILGFYLNVYHQLLCIQLPRWQPPCTHRAALESGPTELEIILMSGRRPVVPRLGGSRLTCSVKF